jgi:hypothetical protein
VPQAMPLHIEHMERKVWIRPFHGYHFAPMPKCIQPPKLPKIPEFRDWNLVVEIERCIAKIPRESLGQIQDPFTSFLVIQHAQWVPQTHRMVPETSVAQLAPLRPQLWMDSGWMDLIVFCIIHLPSSRWSILNSSMLNLIIQIRAKRK